MKTLRKLTLKNLLLNRTRTIVTIIGIMLSTALIVVVTSMATSVQSTVINAQISYDGNYTLEINGLSNNQIADINANRYVSKSFVGDELGCAKIDGNKNKYMPYVGVKGYAKSTFENCLKTDITEGRCPKNNSEIMVSQEFLRNNNKKYKIGDKITLNLGKRQSSKNEFIESSSVYYNTLNDSDVTEKLIDTTPKTYTIVGIMGEHPSVNLSYDSESACSSVITCIDPQSIQKQSSVAFVQFTEDGEKNATKVASQITGVSEKLIDKKSSAELSNAEQKEFDKTSKFNNFSVNKTLLNYKGYGISDESLNMIYGLALIILLIIVFTSIFVIRNSFAISISEKIKLYGMMASVGATSKQIRMNVLFEGLILGLVGISLGLLLGVGVGFLLIFIINFILADMLNGLSIVYNITWLAVVFSIVLSALTIFFSTLSSAIKASRTAPITAIRQNNDVKIKGKKIKSPKYVKKLFGAGGNIAYKNLKRSKKKYRTTVISIIVSVTLFVTMYAFIQYSQTYTEKYFGEIKYNVLLSVNEDSKQNDTEKQIEKIANLSDVDSIDTVKNINLFTYDLDKLRTKDAIESNNAIGVVFVSLDEQRYNQLLKEQNIDYATAKDNGILLNYFKSGNVYKKQFNISNDKQITVTDFKQKDYKINICATVNNKVDWLNDMMIYGSTVIVSDSWVSSHNIPKTYNVYINSSNASQVENDINSMSINSANVTNFDSMVSQNNAMSLILQIFIYGFIIVISLIGITNIFNTITTNMRLRQKEFAILKSVGMTSKEFNKMIRLESIFYGVKSLAIGLPLGIIGSLLILFVFNNKTDNNFVYVFPWIAVLICIVFVFLIVWSIMKFSIKKVDKQNIIETIRNDNI